MVRTKRTKSLILSFLVCLTIFGSVSQAYAQESKPGLSADVLFSLVNTHRQTRKLPPFQKQDAICSLATSRAPEIAAEIAEGRMHQGMYARKLPYWNTENIILMNSETAALNWWLNSPIHRKAIENNYTYSCVACSGNTCTQEFTNFTPKS